MPTAIPRRMARAVENWARTIIRTRGTRIINAKHRKVTSVSQRTELALRKPPRSATRQEGGWPR